MDVVDVGEQPAAGPPYKFGQEFDLFELMPRQGDVERRVSIRIVRPRCSCVMSMLRATASSAERERAKGSRSPR